MNRIMPAPPSTGLTRPDMEPVGELSASRVIKA
jgi:hypothetical protein